MVGPASGNYRFDYLNKKPRNLLRGVCLIDLVVNLFNSKTCPAIGIIHIGIKPDLCFYM